MQKINVLQACTHAAAVHQQNRALKTMISMRTDGMGRRRQGCSLHPARVYAILLGIYLQQAYPQLPTQTSNAPRPTWSAPWTRLLLHAHVFIHVHDFEWYCPTCSRSAPSSAVTCRSWPTASFAASGRLCARPSLTNTCPAPSLASAEKRTLLLLASAAPCSAIATVSAGEDGSAEADLPCSANVLS